MKTYKFTLACFCIVLCLATFIIAPNVQAGNSLFSREVCFRVDNYGEPYATLRLAVTPTGRDTFLLNGVGTFIDDGSTFPYLASGQIIDGQFLMVGTTAVRESDVVAKAARSYTLDLPDLNGTAESVVTIYIKATNQVIYELRSGDVSCIPCKSLKSD